MAMAMLVEALAGANNSAAKDWHGGTGIVAAIGTWGSATLVLAVSPDDGTTWINITGVSLTANGYKSFTIGRAKIRATTSGGTGTDIDVYVQPVVEPVSQSRGS